MMVEIDVGAEAVLLEEEEDDDDSPPPLDDGWGDVRWDNDDGEHRRRSSSSSSLLGRGYALRKFLSTPHHPRHHRRDYDDDIGDNDDGRSHSHRPWSIRRTPSYDPNVDYSYNASASAGANDFHSSTSTSSSLFQNLLVDEYNESGDGDDDGVEGDGDGMEEGHGGGNMQGVEASLISPLYSTPSRPSRARSMSSHAGSMTANLESPVPLKRVPISLRRKKSELSNSTTTTTTIMKKSASPNDDDDLSTVAESIDIYSSSNTSNVYGDDKRRRIGWGPGRVMMRRSRKSFVCAALSTVAILVIAISLSRAGGGTTEKSMNGAEGVVGDGSASASAADDDVTSGHIEDMALIEYGGKMESGLESGKEAEDDDGVRPREEDEEYDDEDNDNGDGVGGGGGGGGVSQGGGIDDRPETTNGAKGGDKDEEDDDPIGTTTRPSLSTKSSEDDGEERGQSANDDNKETAVAMTTTTTISTTTTATTTTPEETVTVFYAMADCPYSTEEREYLMPAYIDGIGSDAEFLVHLGDLQYAQEDHCEEWAYQSASGILMKSRVPTFVLPGDNDINDCDDIDHGKAMWARYFRKLDEYWEHDFDVTRWGELDESFSFLRKGVLYLGLNIPGGTPYSTDDAEERFDEHLERIESILDGLSDDEYKVIVLLGHVDPSYEEAGNSHAFFEAFADIVWTIGKPTVHFHGDYHEYYETEGGDYDVDNYLRISLDGESISPPIRVEIDVSKENPIKVSRRRSGLSVDCCNDGWPSSEEL